MGRTRYWDLSTITHSGETFAEDGYKYVNADRETIALLLHQLANHDHLGYVTEAVELTEPPAVEVNPTGTGLYGNIEGDQRIYYRYSVVSPEGFESAASPESFTDTPVPIVSPEAPAVSRGSTGGTLRPGGYSYMLTVYVGDDTLETAAGPTAAINLPAGSSTQRVEMNFPALPPGASGFNLYRRVPNSTVAHHLATIDAGSAGATFIDTGAEADCERVAPLRSSVGSDNLVGIELPDDVLEDGWTWRLYRTFDPGDWAGSLIADVVEETSEGSGITTPMFVDIGSATGVGSPLEASADYQGPGPIDINTATSGQLDSDRVDLSGLVFRFDQLQDVDLSTPPDEGDVPVWDATDERWKAGDLDGDSAYEIAVADGFVGDEAAWLASLAGKSAYQIAVDNGYLGDEETWLLTLNGSGDSAYQIAVNNGFPGTEAQWLASLNGYSVALANGFVGSQTDWLASLVGKTNYQIAVDNGFVGDQAAWLASIEPDDGASAYDIAVAEGFVGDEAAWLASLEGDVATAVQVNLQSGTSYTLQLSDAGKVIEMNNVAANTLTVPLDSSVNFPIGTIIEICQVNIGQTTIGGGVVFMSPNGMKIGERWGTASLRKRNTNEWVVAGYLEL